MIDEHAIDPIILRALEEDIGPGDITVDALIQDNKKVKAILISREQMVIAGLWVFKRVFCLLSEEVKFSTSLHDGDEIGSGTIIGELKGPASIILKGERVALNFLQRMCGIATLTKKYVDAVAGYKVKILDTRKTTPGLRCLEKYAVLMGGGHNHRIGLYDGVIIKDNHIKAVGSVSESIKRAKERTSHLMKIEVEVENLNQVKEAIEAGADVIMLDNMPPELMRKAVEMGRGRAMFEASGGINLENIQEVAKTGIDMISVGALTHSARAVDISLEFESFF